MTSEIEFLDLDYLTFLSSDKFGDKIANRNTATGRKNGPKQEELI